MVRVFGMAAAGAGLFWLYVAFLAGLGGEQFDPEFLLSVQFVVALAGAACGVFACISAFKSEAVGLGRFFRALGGMLALAGLWVLVLIIALP
jgi:hypothetical protein